MKWTITLERFTENKINPEIARRHLKEIGAAAEKLCFTARAGRLNDPEEVLDEAGRPRKKYVVRLRLTDDGAPNQEQRFAQAVEMVRKAAAGKEWQVISIKKGEKDGPEEVDEVASPLGPRPPFCPPRLDSPEAQVALSGIYERDAHIRILDDAIQTLAVTEGEMRAHTILYGRPGGCKTTILERIREIMNAGQKVERMTWVDAPTLSKAGLERWILELAEAQILPELIVMEEIEKCDKDILLSLGSVLASAYIMRTNAKIGRQVQQAKSLFIVTCNDEESLRGWRNGFLWDRFVNQLCCALPSREVMRAILVDKVSKIPGGDEVWADLALELADQLGVKTPRKIIGFLSGRHRLEDGSFQRDQLDILEAERAEKGAEEATILP